MKNLIYQNKKYFDNVINNNRKTFFNGTWIRKYIFCTEFIMFFYEKQKRTQWWKKYLLWRKRNPNHNQTDLYGNIFNVQIKQSAY